MSGYHAYQPYSGSQPQASHQATSQNPAYTVTQPSQQHTTQNHGYTAAPSSQQHDQGTSQNRGYFPSTAVSTNHGTFDFTPEEALRAIDSALGASSHQPTGQGFANEDLSQENNVQNSQGETVNHFTSPSNFLDKDIESILASTPFLRDDTLHQDTGTYHIVSESLSDVGVTLNGIKMTSWTFENLMSDADFENLLDIFRSVDRLIEGKHLSKREYIQRIQLLGLLINLNWNIKKPPMQVKVWRLMERKLACRKNKMTNKDV